MGNPSDKAPLISVIMGVYNQNQKDLLFQAVYSILDQTEWDLEFIIYDDGSEEEVGRNLDEIAEKDDRIRLIHATENRGLGFALNYCINQAKGIFIARMDADDISHTTRLKKQVEFMEEHPEFSWCGTSALLYDEEGVWGIRMMPEFPDSNDYLKYSPFIHPSVMYRAEIFDKADAYQTIEETLRCEDYEIFMRLHAAGFRGANLQEELLFYRENRDSYQRRTLKNRLNEARVRHRGFKQMGTLTPKAWVYIIRPLVGALVPASLIRKLKRRESALR